MPDELGGLEEGFPPVESGEVVVLGGFEVVPLVAPELSCPVPVVAELPPVPELSVVDEPLLVLLPLVAPELPMLPL